MFKSDDGDFGMDIPEVDIKNHFLHVGGENLLNELIGHHNSDICEQVISILQNYIEEHDDTDGLIENAIEQKATNGGHLFDDRKE